jgi:hypothetical protein
MSINEGSSVNLKGFNFICRAMKDLKQESVGSDKFIRAFPLAFEWKMNERDATETRRLFSFRQKKMKIGAKAD